MMPIVPPVVRNLDRIISNTGDSGGTAYQTDLTADPSYELKETVTISAPTGADFIRVRRLQAEIGARSVGAGRVDCGYSYRFGSDAFSSPVADIGSFVFGSSQNHCGVSDGSTPQSVGLDVVLRGPPATSLDVRFYLRRELAGNTLEYCIRNAKVLYDLRTLNREEEMW